MNAQRKPPTLFPCLRSRMGDWWYYITIMTFDEVTNWVKKVDQIHEREELKTWIQRELRPKRLEEIADYLSSQRQHFFNSVVVGIYRGEPDWYPIQVGKNLAMPMFELPEGSQNAFGFLHLSGDEEIFALDGQHRVEGIRLALAQKPSLAKDRVEGIRLALAQKPSLAKDQQSVIFVAHQETEKGRARTRRLFSTLNKYARPVSKGELVALSEDDAFAIVTRKIIDEYKYLNISFVPLTKTANITSNDTKCITTVLGLYDLIQRIYLKPGSRDKRKLEIGPADKECVQEIYNLACLFWDLLRKSVKEIKEVSDSHPNEQLAAKYRREDGGHLLFRPVGMKAFAQATRTLVDRDMTFKKAVSLLSQTNLDLNSCPWSGVLWNSVAKTVITRNSRLAHNLFLYMGGQPCEPESYDLLSEYRRALDNPGADLQNIRRIR